MNYEVNQHGFPLRFREDDQFIVTFASPIIQ